MGLFNQLAPKFAAKRRTKKLPKLSGSAIQPSDQPAQIVPPTPRSIEQLEQQIILEAQVLSQSQRPPAVAVVRRACNRLIWLTVLLGTPVGAVALVNLPYPPIRHPVAQHAPFLLIPSYMSMDNHFRQSTASLEAATQLIDHATAPADLELGEQKLEQAQTSLDRLPTWVWSEPSIDYRWYSSRFSRSRFDHARAELGRLQSKLFQEKNAQTALTQVAQALTAAEQQYKQAKTPTEQQMALSAWQAELDRSTQIPAQTLAGRMAQQQIDISQRNLQAVGKLSANQQTSSLITAAKEFALQAAQASKNAPHSVIEWQQVMNLWQQAIDRLAKVSEADVGYTEAQKLMATYQANQGQIAVRKQTEADAVRAFEQADQQIGALIANTPSDAKLINRSYTASQLQQIISKLETIDSSTTVYADAQKLLISAQEKLKQWEI